MGRFLAVPSGMLPCSREARSEELDLPFPLPLKTSRGVLTGPPAHAEKAEPRKCPYGGPLEAGWVSSAFDPGTGRPVFKGPDLTHL